MMTAEPMTAERRRFPGDVTDPELRMPPP